ncbi:MAG: hypothetical protein JXB62_00275, partial [Pirellulales bacterium]|nr:hypothetical protein [Pirellulales bacterium]
MIPGRSAQAVAIAPDGSRIVVGNGYTLQISEIQTGMEYAQMEGGEIQWSAGHHPSGTDRDADSRHLRGGRR